MAGFDFASVLAGLASKTAEQSISNAINLGFARRANRVNLAQARKLNEIQLENEQNAPQMEIAGLKKAGINPFVATGTPSGGMSAPSPTSQYSQFTSALDVSALSRLSKEIENIESVSDLNRANARKANADAQRQEIENYRETSYDTVITDLFNKYFPDENGSFYANKGSLDAKFDFFSKDAGISEKNRDKLKAEYEKFAYEHLNNEEDKKLFYDSVKSQFKEIINKAGLSDLDLDLKKKDVLIKDIDVYLKELEKKIADIDYKQYQYTNVFAFLEKEDKTWEDWAGFIALSLIRALATMKQN